MRNNTIEIRLTSYGTLEVVTIPVKLYKDSYKVVKLRVSAVEKENSFLKVYASDRDEAGEQVWTSATYDLPYVDKEIINGVTYNVYEDYLPQEFCTKDEVNVTFAHVVEADGVEQILTSGTLNLTIGGEGFNYNGTQIPQQDSLAIKVNNLLENSSQYDLVINTQAKFEQFIHSIINKTSTARAVLIVGGVYTAKINQSLKLPIRTLKRIDGINRARIRLIDDSEGGLDKVIQYDTIEVDPSISDGTVISNIEITFESNIKDEFTPSCLYGLHKLINVHVFLYNKNASLQSVCYDKCYDLVNCSAEGGSYAYGFKNCNRLTQCVASVFLIPFYNCINIVNCYGYSLGGTSNYLSCKNIINSTGNGGASWYDSVFYDCSNLTNCYKMTDTADNIMLFKECTYINATQEDVNTLKQYIDDKIGEVNTALTDLNSGEGV